MAINCDEAGISAARGRRSPLRDCGPKGLGNLAHILGEGEEVEVIPNEHARDAPCLLHIRATPAVVRRSRISQVIADGVRVIEASIYTTQAFELGPGIRCSGNDDIALAVPRSYGARPRHRAAAGISNKRVPYVGGLQSVRKQNLRG